MNVLYVWKQVPRLSCLIVGTPCASAVIKTGIYRTILKFPLCFKQEIADKIHLILISILDLGWFDLHPALFAGAA